MEETILYLGITLFELLWGEWNLCQIVFTFVRVVGCGVKTCFLLFCLCLNSGNGIALSLSQLRFIIIFIREVANNRLVSTLPVIYVIAFAPSASKGLLTLLNSSWVVEIPC